MKSHIKGLLAGGLYVLCNYIIAYIPCWHLRKLLYMACGMKIGKHSRIMMRVVVTHPWKIIIGANTTINEFCYLDGRGGLNIGDNVNIALYSMLITGTHNRRLKGFDLYTEPILIGNDVWLAARTMVLNGCDLGNGCLLGAGSVLMPRTKCFDGMMYCGVPAKLVKSRGLEGPLELDHWNIHFR